MERSGAYSAISHVMNAVQGAAKELYNLQVQRKKLTNDGSIPSTITVDKAVFVGTTEDVIAKLRAKKEKKDVKAVEQEDSESESDC